MKWQQVLERIVWSGLVAAGTVAVGGAIFDWDVPTIEAIASAGIGGVLNAVTQFGRYRLSVLPNPGEGLPGAEVS